MTRFGAQGGDSWRPAHSVPELFVPSDGCRGLQALRVDAQAVHALANTGAQNTASKPAKSLTGFFKRLAQYYAEFLSTDFKKQRLPRRRLENADAQGRLVGITLRKYPGFQQKLWGELAKPIGAGLSVTVSRGSWRAVLPKAVVETTVTYIAQVTQKDVDVVVNGVMKNTLRLANQKDDDPEIAFEQFIEEVRANLARAIIGPLLDRMEGFFARTENKPVESLRELEDQLSARLGSGIEKSSGAAFSKLLVEGSSESLEWLLRDQLEINLIRRELEAFFATFTAADLYVDLSDLVRSSRLVENADLYMHIGEIHHAGHVFPIFYIPFTAERTEQGFKINSEPRLYVNKRAMDYVAQEVAKAEGRATIPSMLRERIFYDGEWADMPMPQRLVFDSPLPLVEEQRKIVSAIKHPKSRFIAVEGPPGTGKSHTITAVAFDLILAGKNLLVLSDKKEALDVVEDKLNQALTKVRPSEDFPNPILRLGMDASNYGQLLKKSAIERLQVNQRVVRQRRPEREKAFVNERAELVKGLEKTAETYAKIDIARIAELERDTADLAGKNPDAAAILADQRLSELAGNFGVVSEYLRSHTPLAAMLRWQGAYPGRLNEISRLVTALSSFPAGSMDIGPIIAFSFARLRALENEIKAIEDSKNALFGYLFAGKKLREIARKLHDECGLECEHPRRDVAKLKLWRNNLHKLRDFLAGMHLEAEFEVAVVLIAAKLVGADKPALAPAQVLDAARHLDEAMKLSTPLLASARGKFYSTVLDGSDVPLALLDRLGALKRREADIREKFIAIPQVNYIGAKTKIESLNTQLLAERIDERLIEFYDHKKNDALALGKIIREKQRFPVDKFADIQRAFPCIIAGLRDYAEFIPLERELFDLVIIDEASQVSIAQALPAIIRAKKVLVLGDRNQFGNVKTTNASHEVNAAYMQDLIKAFSEDFANAGQEVRTKIDYFNIRRSVLDFIEPISNFSIQLKKHFRSYPEMISFSSKYFYGDSLQATKIRGKPIEDVIEFDRIEHDGLVDQRNVNALEGRRIIDRIAELIDLEGAPSVGVITPHTEQQALIGKLVHEHPRSDEFYDKLRLKVMTFDTCQGEEREMIFYSLVATAEKDRLAYVFPSKLDCDKSDAVDHNLRLQRLNVGLSRGQEKIIFVHSKPLDQYSSALRTALFHYRSELERAKSMPTENDLDKASPMERQVLHWLGQVPLIRDLDGDCEIIAQFGLGKYLKQLDPTYHHPDYCVDFLIRVSDAGKQHQLVLEYDGFEFHFAKGVPPGMINSSTWRMYLTAEDLEREKVLESFGVQMIRLNKFNLGKDPVATIDDLLRERLDGMNNGRQPHDLVKSVAEKANEIEEGLRLGTISAARSATAIFRSTCFKTAVQSPGSDGFAGNAKQPRRRQTINQSLGVATAGGDSVGGWLASGSGLVGSFRQRVDIASVPGFCCAPVPKHDAFRRSFVRLTVADLQSH